MKMKTTLMALAVASIFVVACTSIPVPVVPDGSDRIPINSSAQIEDYKARTAEETANFTERTALTRQVEGLQKQVAELKAYMVMLHMLAENGQINPALLVPRKVTQAPSPEIQSPVAEAKNATLENGASPATVGQAPAAKPTPAKTSQVPAQSNDEGNESVEVRDHSTIVFRVTHALGKSEFKPSPKLQVQLLAAAREGKRIEIRGRTDALHENEFDRKIAMQRALSAREFLVSNGIDPSRIRARYLAIGGFVADNNTVDGKRQNRRVEIETLDVDIAALELKMSMTFGPHSS